MKKIIVILGFMLLANIGYSQYVTDTTKSVALVTYTLSWDSSYRVVNKGGDIFVMFDWKYKEYLDGELIKDETRTEKYNITGNQVWIEIFFPPAVVNGVKGILNNKKKQLAQ